MDLAENSDTEGMLEVLRDERKEYIVQNKESKSRLKLLVKLTKKPKSSKKLINQ